MMKEWQELAKPDYERIEKAFQAFMKDRETYFFRKHLTLRNTGRLLYSDGAEAIA
jgi:hypothetical protein